MPREIRNGRASLRGHRARSAVAHTAVPGDTPRCRSMHQMSVTLVLVAPGIPRFVGCDGGVVSPDVARAGAGGGGQLLRRRGVTGHIACNDGECVRGSAGEAALTSVRRGDGRDLGAVAIDVVAADGDLL